MALVRYNPWQELNSLQRQLNSLFDDTLNTDTPQNFNNLTRFPAAEMTESEEALTLRIEVPGMASEDLEIEAMADRVAISGERKSTVESEDKTRSEFRYGKFQRVIPLPARIQNTEVTAGYKDGILTLTLPKSEAEKNKVVKVSLNADA